MVAPERKYALTRVRAGDYLLPSNDGLTLWRICAYYEDGSAAWQDDAGKWHTVTGRRWRTAKYRDGMPAEGTVMDDAFFDPWSDYWLDWHTGLLTRAEAIKAALA